MVLGEEAIFTTQSRDPQPRSMKRKPYKRFTGICEIIRLPCCSYFCGWQEGSTCPGDVEHVESFLLESNSGESKEHPSQSRYI